MNTLTVIGMGLGAFLMWEAFHNQLDPLTTLKALLTSTPVTTDPGANTGASVVQPGTPDPNTTATPAQVSGYNNGIEHILRPTA